MEDFKAKYTENQLYDTERELRKAKAEIRRLETELAKWQDIVHTLIKK